MLIVKRNENDELFPGAWEFLGWYLENNELIKNGLKRELFEVIGFDKKFIPIITHYFDEIKEKNGQMIHMIEIDFVINVNRNDINIVLNNEYLDYKWVTKESEDLGDFIKDKLQNI